MLNGWIKSFKNYRQISHLARIGGSTLRDNVTAVLDRYVLFKREYQFLKNDLTIKYDTSCSVLVVALLWRVTYWSCFYFFSLFTNNLMAMMNMKGTGMKMAFVENALFSVVTGKYNGFFIFFCYIYFAFLTLIFYFRCRDAIRSQCHREWSHWNHCKLSKTCPREDWWWWL